MLLLLAQGITPSRLTRSHTPTWTGTALVQEAGPACVSNCSGHGACHGGTCYCRQGWAGPHCAALALGCPHNCSGHGSCRRGTCTCDGFHEGPACETAIAGCLGFCSHAGHCVGGACRCEPGRTGPDCAQSALASAPCPSECGGGGRGTCVAGTCHCIPPFTGAACLESTAAKSCPSRGGGDCSGHGACDTVTGACSCDAEHEGEACELNSAEQRTLRLIVAAVAITTVLCLAAGGLLAYGRFVRGLSLTDMRKGRWEPPEDEGWRPGAATNMLPTARFEVFQAHPDRGAAPVDET